MLGRGGHHVFCGEGLVVALLAHQPVGGHHSFPLDKQTDRYRNVTERNILLIALLSNGDHTHAHTHTRTRTTLTLLLCYPQVILQHFHLKQHEVLRQCREWRRVFAEAAENKKHLTTVSAKLRILDSLLPQLERKLAELKPDQFQTNTSST